MATCLEIITDALVWRGVLPEGRAPSAKMTLSAMNTLIALYQDLIGTGALGPLRSVSIDAEYNARPGDRIINTTGTPFTINFPQTVEAWCCDEGVAPLDRSFIIIVGPNGGTWLYGANAAQWVKIEDLEPEDEAPMSATLREGLTAAVTQRLRYPGLALDANVPRAVRAFEQAITHHYAERREQVSPYRPYCDYLPEC